MADPITTTPISTPPPIPVAPAVPSVTQAPVTAPPPTGGSSKGMIWVILAAFLVVAAMVGVGIYMYTRVKDSNPAFQQISQSTQESLTSAENDLSGATETDVSADFTDIDKELNNL